MMNQQEAPRRKIFGFLAPPHFADEDKQRSARFIHAISLGLIVLITLLLVVRLIASFDITGTTNLILIGLFLAMLVVQYITRAGRVFMASLMMTALGWLAMTYLAFVSNGVRDEAVLAYIPIILIASLLIGWRASAVFSAFSIAVVWVMATLETRGILVTATDNANSIARNLTAIFALATYLIYLLVSSLRTSLEQARKVAKELSINNAELDGLRTDLEHRVETRTAQLEKRAGQLEAIAKVSRSIATIQDIDELLPAISRVVGDQFRFYHTGIFLISENNQYAVLRATNSDGGRKMLARSHRLPVEATSVVGYAASRGEARIALDVGSEAIFFNNPDLPDTRSEMAIPLRIAERTIGVLDVQSMETNAFGHEDIGVLQILADQIAIAIENTRLFGETRRALNESQSVYQRYIKQEWSRFTRRLERSGYRYDGAKTVAVDKKVEKPEIATAIEKGEIIISSPSGEKPATLAVPVKTRGQAVGIIYIQATDTNRQWTKDEIVLAQAAAERAAIALENIRLLNEAQRRAAKERTISAVSAKLGSSINMTNVMQTAAEELGRTLPGAEIVIQFVNQQNGNQQASGK